MEARRQDDTEIVDVDQAQVDPGWDDPEEAATRVQAGSPSAELHMDWDEEEPPTQMRGEAGVNTLSDVGSAGVPMDWDDEEIDTRLRGAEGDAADTSAYQPAGDSGRPSPFPSRPSLPPHASQPPVARASFAPAAASVRPGAPSPFLADDAVAETAWGQDLRTDRKNQLWLAAGALCIIALGFGVRAMFAKDAPGLVTLATVPADAKVLVDGKPVAGTSSPFSATDLTPGVAHEVVIERDGYATQRSTFTLQEGEAKTLPTIELASAQKDTGLAIDSTPSGAQLQIDGQPTGLTTPARLTHVDAGMHKIALVRDGFAAFELQVFVPKDQVLELPTAALVAGGNAKKSVAQQEPVASASDAEPTPVPTSSRDRRHHHHHGADSARAPVATRQVATRPAPAARVARTKPIKAVTAAPVAGKGVLRVNSRPWSQVFVDGRMVGNTPQMALQLAAGKHTIKLSNPQMGLSKTFGITVTAGQTQTKVMNLIE
jgi:hypothetical protein